MLSLMVSALEKMINRYLSMDASAGNQLRELSGKIVELDIPSWKIKLYIIPTQQGIRLTQQITEQKADTVISGEIQSLLRIIRAKGDNSALFNNNIEISGDIQLLEKLKNIMQQIDIDWETQLSKYIGDTGAYQSIRLANKLYEQKQAIKQKLSTHTKDYLHHESDLLANKEQFDDFSNQIAELRNATDRIEARINQYKGNNSVSSSFS